ncbi:Putative SANT/Myb domain, Homeobox-like domain superfamily, Helicase/SANT-associated [Septoria linicola]|uniref:Vacuolar import and degradation protein 21 n=1 Tax=Septoria linicola TaxID=215465 RepID=A0A9Q9AYU9_9PEZI|nr:putative SANT/Myb domain, Homeobox-like domain superfamily, Helicase/SANT-associated [Septoria linicola]USW57635.1 Putative SANT/Myb domain, Homeobox-like domain superfamily, Helicase/SANT-associated [Septoria linicola]
MSSVESLRHAALAAKHDQLKSLASSHSAELRALLAVYNTINDNTNLNSLVNANFDALNIAEDEAEFLRNHDLSSGRTFDATTQLTIRPPPQPTPRPQILNDSSKSVANPNSVPAGSSGTQHATPAVAATPERGIVTAQADESASSIPEVVSRIQETLPVLDKVETRRSSAAPPSRKASVQPEDARPVDVAVPLPEENAQLSTSTQQFVDSQQPSRPAKTVHLPPQEVQEEKLREREAAERRRRSESEVKLSQRLAAPQAEAASSPSSTVGAYSAATPQLAQESPDTSPDSEAALEVPKDLQPSAEQVREKEEHDRLLEAQKEIARQQALGDVSTPDDQLKWEERAAAAREATERVAREEASGLEPDAKDSTSRTEIELAIDGTEVNERIEHTRAQQVEDAKPTPKVAETGNMPPPVLQDDGDNITVARSKSQLSANSAKVQSTQSSTSVPPRMTTRVSSGAMRQKSVSEILGQDRGRSQSTDHVVGVRKEMRTPEPVSPFTQRHPHDSSGGFLGSSPASHTKQPLLAQYRHTDDINAVMGQLESLKGAAEDPEKDYLEPLFRIQAHESQNSRSRTLPELIKIGSKALATEDHFTSMHERLDFRMLRRIYQLQNANKWSLRQMEKQKEPEQPFTHHDHMMEEMKWMRKDFRAERQMKKSVCAWLAQRCAEFHHADASERKRMQIKPKAIRARSSEELSDPVPDLDGGESGPEDDASPPTPREGSPMPTTIVIPLELVDAVDELRKSGKLSKALSALPEAGLLDLSSKHLEEPYTAVSKFVTGKVLPAASRPSKKRSRYDYADEDELLEAEPKSKRLRETAHQDPEGTDCALFDPINKPIRDRLHSNNAFRPPSEFLMPNTQFYEYRTGSQWVWEDDQKLRKLAKDYSFNWSLIADEMALPSRYKSAAERRTPWECFERWVDLESLPADMRKTVYFKTWYARLEQAQQASERRYQQQVQVIQQQAAQNGAPSHVPIRRKTTPTRVEKRRSTRYLWMVEGFRKLAKKREQAAWKQAETARAAAQRKSQNDSNPPGPRMKMTPQEFSKKRAERDAVIAEQQRQHRLKMLEAQRQQIAAARAAQQMQMAGGPQAQAAAAGQQRPPAANMPAQQAQMQANGQQVPNLNAQMAASQGRAGLQMATRNGHLAPPPVNGIPQAQMTARGSQATNMQAQPNNVQMRNAQYSGQPYAAANGNIAPSQQVSGMTTQQQLQENQALLAAFRQQQQQQQQQGGAGHNSNQQMNGSPSMPPPPTPQSAPQKLSSGHTPQIYAITNQVRAANPSLTEEQVNALAIQQLSKQTNQQSSNQARQNAMNAASGMPNQSQAAQAYPQKQGQYTQRPMANGANGVNGMYSQTNGSSNGQSQAASGMSPQGNNTNPSQAQDDYRAQLIRNQQLQMPQMRQMQSPNNTAAQLYGSPVAANASPHLSAASPGQSPYQNVNQMAQIGSTSGQRPSSRSNTPQMQRLSSSGSVNTIGTGGGMQSPGAMGIPQNSPRSLPTPMAQ